MLEYLRFAVFKLRVDLPGIAGDWQFHESVVIDIKSGQRLSQSAGDTITIEEPVTVKVLAGTSRYIEHAVIVAILNVTAPQGIEHPIGGDTPAAVGVGVVGEVKIQRDLIGHGCPIGFPISFGAGALDVPRPVTHPAFVNVAVS